MSRQQQRLVQFLRTAGRGRGRPPSPEPSFLVPPPPGRVFARPDTPPPRPPPRPDSPDEGPLRVTSRRHRRALDDEEEDERIL